MAERVITLASFRNDTVRVDVVVDDEDVDPSVTLQTDEGPHPFWGCRVLRVVVDARGGSINLVLINPRNGRVFFDQVISAELIDRRVVGPRANFADTVNLTVRGV